jgi:hypothetical protein
VNEAILQKLDSKLDYAKKIGLFISEKPYFFLSSESPPRRMNSRPQGYEERIYFYNSMIIRVLKIEKVTFWSKKD